MGNTAIKHCRSCGRDVSATGFHKRQASHDGLSAVCKRCQRAYDAARLHKPERVALRAAYRATSHGKCRLAAGAKAWCDRNPDKRHAHIIVGNAIRDGVLTKSECEICGSTDVHAHHDDYTKPLDVRWLCPKHHSELHVILDAQEAA